MVQGEQDQELAEAIERLSAHLKQLEPDALSLIATIRGKPMNERNQEIGFKIGMAVLGTMMFAAILGDIMRKLGLV